MQTSIHSGFMREHHKCHRARTWCRAQWAEFLRRGARGRFGRAEMGYSLADLHLSYTNFGTCWYALPVALCLRNPWRSDSTVMSKSNSGSMPGTRSSPSAECVRLPHKRKCGKYGSEQ